MTSTYELDHASASFLRGYWDGYMHRPARCRRNLSQFEYAHDYRSGTADRSELETRMTFASP